MNTSIEYTTSLELEVADLAWLNQSKKDCNDQMLNIEVFHTQTDYLPSVYNRFNRLNSTLNQATVRLRESTQRLRLNLDSRAKIMGRYLLDLEDAYDDEDRMEILEDMAKDLNSELRETRSQSKILASALLSVSDTYDRSGTLRYLAGFTAEQERWPQEIQEIEARRAKVEEQRATVTAAINAINSQGFGAIAKDAVLTGERVASMGTTPPQAEAIAMALDMLKQSLDKMDVSLNFLGLVSLRDRLRERSNEFDATLRAKQRELGLLNRRVSMIEAVHAFDDHLQDYRREYSKIVSSVQDYEALFTRFSHIDENMVEVFIAETSALVNYLRPIR